MDESARQQQQLQQTKRVVQIVLAQDRQVENFVHYTVSDQHAKRMQRLAQLAPELYDNAAWCLYRPALLPFLDYRENT